MRKLPLFMLFNALVGSAMIQVDPVIPPSRHTTADSMLALAETSAVLPAGSRVLTRLAQPLSLRSALPADTIYFHVVSAVRVGRQMVIPRGAFVEATISNLDERDVNGRLEVRLRLRRLIDAGGDIADFFAVDASPNDSAYRRGVIGVAEVESPGDNGDILPTGSPITLVAQSAFTADTHRSLASAFGGAARVVGSPPRLECFVASRITTPDVRIPGTPGTPAVGDFPAVPSTPDVVLPGTPTSLGHWQPCR